MIKLVPKYQHANMWCLTILCSQFFVYAINISLSSPSILLIICYKIAIALESTSTYGAYV